MFGGPGAADVVDYVGVSAPVTVVPNDGADDGVAGEGDNVHSDLERIVGGTGPDTLSTPVDGGEVWGRDGNDTLFGGNSDDLLEGGDGNDTLDGRFSADAMNGGPGIDTVDYTDHYVVFDDPPEIFGAASTPNGLADDGNGFIDRHDGGGPTFFDNVNPDIENIIGSGGPDVLQGSTAANVINGGPQADAITGGNGNDELNGQDGVDSIEGGGDQDTLRGDAGPDNLDGGPGADAFDGGSEVDIVTYANRSAAVRVTINNIANDGDIATNESDNVLDTVENVRGGAGADLLTGNAQANRLLGGNGDDSLNGGDGADVLDGQTGIDTISYANRTARVAVTLDGLRNDGADPNANGISNGAEEGDQDLNIENATGGDGPDILRAVVADAVVNVLRGLAGDDTLEAREGTATVDNLVCGDGTADQFAADPSDTQAGCEVVLP
jgi:Ca2+-binding RTX toxin-like protein